ncbi:MAG: MXAN_5187 C-terminal domain-containing protein [Thermodesulfobacteriota bacterium]
MGINEAIDLLESKLNRLKTEYEQYFLRILKKEPTALRSEVERLITQCSGQPIHNTATKFRLNSLTARYHSHKNYWTRVLRAIEEGTYHRDVFKMNLPIEESPSSTVETTSPSSPGTDGDGLRELFDEYIKIRKRCKEEVKGITFKKLKEVMQTSLSNPSAPNSSRQRRQRNSISVKR